MTRLALFIDYANIWSTYKTKWQKIDFPRLLDFVEEQYWWILVMKHLYTAYPEAKTRDYNVDGIHKFCTYITKALGFQVTKKPLKRIKLQDEHGAIILWTDGNPCYQEKWNLDIELAIDVVSRNMDFDTMILMSGDSDFLPLVNFLRRKWKKSYVLSSYGHISTELRTGGDGYTDLTDTPEIWWEKLRYRNEKP